MYFGQKTHSFFVALMAALFIVSLITGADAKAPVVTHKITVTQNAGGTIAPKGSGSPAQLAIKDSKDAPFTITPAKGYHVASIVTDAGDITSAATKAGSSYKYKFPKVTGDHTITATFAKDTYTLTVNLSGPDSTGRTVTADSGSLTCNDAGTSCTGAFEYGTSVTLTETPGLNSELQKWTGCKAQSAKCSVSITKNMTVAVKFKAAKVAATSAKKVSGHIQKGPFINGTAVTIYELDNELTPTGKSFSAQTDNLGAFEVSNVSLKSQYVELKADGYYYNEVSGIVSVAPITLYALVDLTDKSAINVNILTHLERERVKALIAKGYTFANAKKQAQKEIFAIFEITKDDIVTSETLDLSKDGEDNGILLAISVILQGNRTEGEMSELLANIISDLEANGTLLNAANGSALINGAKYTSLTNIRKILEDRYKSLGTTATIPDITNIIANFMANTEFQLTEFITYPSSGTYGLNVLDKNITSYQKTVMGDTSSYPTYSLTAVLPKGHSLKVKVTGDPTLDNGQDWVFAVFESSGWQSGDFDAVTHSRTFTAKQTGTLDLKLFLLGGKITFDVYEDGAESPTWTKTITLL